MQRRLIALWAVLLASAGLVLPHGEGNSLMGTVSKVDAQSLGVKTADGHVVSVRLDKTTSYLRGKEKATLADVKLGSRVVVHLMHHEGPPMAAEVLLQQTKPDDAGHEHGKPVPGKG